MQKKYVSFRTSRHDQKNTLGSLIEWRFTDSGDGYLPLESEAIN
jgi:hypothetical protein